MSSPTLYPIELPSLGLPYGGLIPAGAAHVSHLLTKDEKSIADNKMFFEIQNDVLDRCLHLPAGITQRELLLGDRLYAFFMARAVSYGPMYDFEFRCEVCGKKSTAAVDITKMPVKRLPDGFVEPIVFELPHKKDIIEYRLLRGTDDDFVHKAIRLSKDTETGRVIQLARSLVSINGEKPDTSSSMASQLASIKAQQYINSLLPWDTGAWQNDMADHDPGIDLRVNLDCQNRLCKAENEVDLQILQEFFRPARTRRR